MLKLTVLIDNQISISDLSSQHGLSIWLESGESRILFDTGLDSMFMKNAQALDIEVITATHLLLSHGHYDHTGGVPELLNQGAHPTLVIGPEAWFQRKSTHPIGIRWCQEILEDLNVIINQNAYNIEPGIIAANIGSRPDAALRHLKLQRFVDGHWEPDTFPDEQILILQTTEGLVVITGCTHCGVDALINFIKMIAGNTPIYALIGGLHLFESTHEDIQAVAEKLRSIKHIWTNHCTGPKSFAKLQEILGPQIEWAGAGFHTELPPLIK
jgi:7,8-dihydropterin-6-yl-methyl-4-(beta-D-ribofuranosyl)aminobenzene 5'-phosphate synthase